MAEPRRTTRFRPCIDLHNGVVKQIVGSTLKDAAGAGGGGASADKDPVENFASSLPSADYAAMYRRDGLTGGHVIMLGPGNEEAALAALRAYPNGLQVGGGVTPANAHKYLDAGASHVIVTSYVFKNGRIDMDKLAALVEAVGRERLVLDLSCRRKPGDGPGAPYYVVTDRWQKFTDFAVTEANLRLLAASCDEFLVHGVDVEGKQCGIMEDLVEMLGRWSSIPCTYAGGIRNEDDVALVDRLGRGRVDYTIGSALDIFGGQLVYADVVKRDQARTRLQVEGGGAAASGQEAPHATGNAARANAALVGVAVQLLLAVTAIVLQRRPAKRE